MVGEFSYVGKKKAKLPKSHLIYLCRYGLGNGPDADEYYYFYYRQWRQIYLHFEVEIKFEALKRPDQLWGPTSLLSTSHQMLFHRDKDTEAWNWPVSSICYWS
jgi:hypothetical protein